MRTHSPFLPPFLLPIQWLSIFAATCALFGCGSDDSDPTPSNTPSPIAISDARGMADGNEVTLEGVISVPSGLFNSATGDQGFAVQDASGGVYVSIAEHVDGAVGDTVRVKGKLAQVAQQTVLMSDASSVELLGGSGSIAVADAKTGDIGEDVEGRMVHVTGAITQPVGDDSPYGFKVFIDDGSGEVQIFVHIVDGAPLVNVDSLSVDQSIEVTGLAAQYETTYEVLPRSAADVVTP